MTELKDAVQKVTTATRIVITMIGVFGTAPTTLMTTLHTLLSLRHPVTKLVPLATRSFTEQPFSITKSASAEFMLNIQLFRTARCIASLWETSLTKNGVVIY